MGSGDTSAWWDALSLGPARRRRRLRRLMGLNRRGEVVRPRAAIGGPGYGSRYDSWARRAFRRVAMSLVVVGTLLVLDLLDRIPLDVVSHLGDPADQVSSYEFMYHQDGRPDVPVTRSPCHETHFVVNVDDAPPEAYELTAEAIDEIAAATGLRLVVDGRTGELPSALRASGAWPDWQPVLVAWTDEDTDPALEGNAGVARTPQATWPESQLRVIVSGQISLATPYLSRRIAAGDVQEVRAVLLHELGHVMGLGHVDDPTQVMGGGDRLGLGDREGLRLLGRGVCRR